MVHGRRLQLLGAGGQHLTKPFDFVDSITFTKEDLLAAGADPKDYVPYLTNKALSYFPDTILYANQMNVDHHLPKDMQYAYLFGSIRKRKRRSPWAKADAEQMRLLNLVSVKYNISVSKARQVLPLLTEQQIKSIEASMEQGGY